MVGDTGTTWEAGLALGMMRDSGRQAYALCPTFCTSAKDLGKIIVKKAPVMSRSLFTNSKMYQGQKMQF